jgi:hypothetical protein
MHETRVHEPPSASTDPLRVFDEAIRRVRRQACVAGAGAVASVAVAVADRRVGTSAALAAAVCCASLLGVGWLLDAMRRWRIHDLILRSGWVESESFADELGRLRRRSNCDRLATGLERALADGCRWAELLPASRPPPGARHLAANAAAIGAITAGLRAGHASPRAIVMLERLMRGGYGSALYGGGPEWLRRELGRIRFEIESVA